MVNAAATAVRNSKKGLVGPPSVLKWVIRWRSAKGTFNKDPLDFAADNRGILQSQGPNPLVPGGPLCATWDQLQEIGKMYVGADHREAKALPTWTSFYKQAPRDIPCMTSSGATTLKTVRTIPCHNCGVILPSEFCQVDHKQPPTRSTRYESR